MALLLLPGVEAGNGDVPQGELGLSVPCSEAFPGLGARPFGGFCLVEERLLSTSGFCPKEVTEPHSQLGCCCCVAGWGSMGS